MFSMKEINFRGQIQETIINNDVAWNLINDADSIEGISGGFNIVLYSNFDDMESLTEYSITKI